MKKRILTVLAIVGTILILFFCFNLTITGKSIIDALILILLFLGEEFENDFNEFVNKKIKKWKNKKRGE